MPVHNEHQSANKSAPLVKYKPSPSTKIVIILAIISFAIYLVLTILMSSSILYGSWAFIPIISAVFTYILLIIILLDVRSFHYKYNRDRIRKSSKEEYFIIGIILGIVLGIFIGIFLSYLLKLNS